MTYSLYALFLFVFLLLALFVVFCVVEYKLATMSHYEPFSMLKDINSIVYERCPGTSPLHLTSSPQKKYINALKKAQAQFNSIKIAYQDEKDFGEEQGVSELIDKGIADIRNTLINTTTENKGEKNNV